MNKLKFLLEYDKYIKSIIDLTTNDDMIMFEKFNKIILNEGLIFSYPLDKSIKILSNRFPNLKITSEPDGEITIEDVGELKQYLPLINNIGYFIAIVTYDGINWVKEYTEDSIVKGVMLEPKYDIKIEDIPAVLYHVSPVRFKDKINKIGFIPKTGNTISNHPERIYLTHDINMAIDFGIKMKDFNLYQINGKCINAMYSDINLRGTRYYVLHNIRPECFKLLK